MEDEKIKAIFRDFDPEISSDTQFLARLQRSMESVELVKQHNLAARKRYKTAMLIAAVAGFVVGAVFTIVLPYAVNWLSTITFSLPTLGIKNFAPDWQLVGWIVTGLLSVTTAINAYEIALTKLKPTKILQ